MTRPERFLTASFIGILLAAAVFLIWRSQRIPTDPLGRAIHEARVAEARRRAGPHIG